MKLTIDQINKIPDAQARERLKATYEYAGVPSDHLSPQGVSTIVDTSTEWMILVKNDAYEKGRKEGYASASEHVLPVLQQKKEMIKQLDSLLKKFLDSMGNELTVAIDALEMNRARIHDKDKQIQDQKELLNTRSKAISSLREEVESLKRENEALQKKVEEKPKRGRPRKKKEEDPLD